MKKLKQNIIVLFFGMGLGMSAQETETFTELITDRPDATESPNTVPLKSLQIETGAYYESFKDGNIKNEVLGYNTSLLRYGLLNNLELRLGWDFEEGRSAINDKKLDNISSGFSPLLFGMKVEITQERGLLPDIGLMVHLNLPFLAGTDYKPETTGANFIFAFGHTLCEKSSLSYNLGAEWGNDSPEIAYLYSVAYGYSITDKLGAYAEVYGDFPEDNQANHLWDVGLTYLLQHNLQLDTTVGKSFTNGQDILLSAGLSIRIPN